MWIAFWAEMKILVQWPFKAAINQGFLAVLLWSVRFCLFLEATLGYGKLGEIK